MKLAEKAQSGIATAARRAEDRRWPVALVAATFDETPASKESEAGAGVIAWIAKGRVSRNRKATTKIEVDSLPPQQYFTVWILVVRSVEDARLLVLEAFAIELKIQRAISQEHTIDVGQVVLYFAYSATDWNMMKILKDDLGIVEVSGG